MWNKCKSKHDWYYYPYGISRNFNTSLQSSSHSTTTIWTKQPCLMSLNKFLLSFVCCIRKLFTTWYKYCFCWLSLVILLVWNSDTRPKALSAESFTTLKYCIIFLPFWYSRSSGHNQAGLHRKETQRFKRLKNCHEHQPDFSTEFFP